MLKTLLSQVKEYKLPSILTPLCMLGEVICEMIIPVLMARIVDIGIYGQNMDYIFKTGGMMIVIAILGLLAGLGGAYYGSKASTGFAKNLRKAMFDNIQTFSFSNIDKFSTSGLVTRLTTDVTNIQNAYMMTLRMAMRAPSSMIVALVMSFIISPRLASIYFIAVLFLSVIIVFVMNRASKYFKEVFEKYDALNESVQENVSAIRVVKAYVREDYENDKFKKAARNIYNMFVKAEMNVVYMSPLMTGTVYACILLISWFGAHMIVGGELSTGNLMSLLTYCMNILMSLMFLAVIFVMLTMASASGKRIAEVIDEKADLTNPENPVAQVKDGSISFENVDFAYDRTSDEPVLKNINLEIKSGETIGIIGGTGSAKSSLVNLISRLYDVTKGTVKVGDVDVREYDMETLRDQVSVVLQKNVLFSGTILDNLRWGNKDATEEECKRACQMACADEFIERMPDGYNTVIEQGGTNVSGGQRQRLCIARALLKKPKILILDDSTSAVDTATDARIRKAFAEEIPGTTKLIIAQRISSVQNCDRIIVMDDGQVNGFGTHEELLKTNDIYREVYESQTGASGDADFDRPSA
ncbi:ABC transporter ATP-binding protein [Butyrivibrio sp. CB08]|uniref:ABC transporter ATP-binding protein n=1 Tax=Butyrivibrio sp. CB08 TaxID=2364879 RepID=UPI000EA87408|nr:ABC transporter ATP-binding protein [Butyrivibrio sp. CB08]RKM62018.1 ABC transporter ATP-binding protein [Butyrivibrio sp. CB08]